MLAQAHRLRLPLLVPLLVAVLLEMALHRASLQLLKPQVLEPETELFRLFNGGVGPLFLFFASFVALTACAWILVVVVRHEGLFVVPWRVVIGLFACVFLPVAAVGVFVSQAGIKPLSHSLRELHPYLNLFFAPILAAVTAALWIRRGSLRAKIGTLFFVIPLLGFAYFSYRTATALGQGPGGLPIFEQLRQVSSVPRWLRTFWLHSGPVVFLAFLPLIDLVERKAAPGAGTWTERLHGKLGCYGRAFLEPGPMLVGLGTGVLLGIGIRLDFGPLRAVVDAALAYDLPSPSVGSLFFLASLSLFVWTVAALAFRPGPTRLAATGLFFVGIAGLRLAEPLHSLQLAEPLYYLLVLVGLLALTVGIAGAWDRAAELRLTSLSPAISEQRWSAFLKSLVTSFAADADARGQESTCGMAVRRLVENDVDLSGIQGHWRGIPMSIFLCRVESRVESLCIVIGEALNQGPDWTASRTSGAGTGARPAPTSPPVPTSTAGSASTPAASTSGLVGQPVGQSPVQIHDRSGITDRLLEGGLAQRLAGLVDGEVEIWRHLGLRYRYQVDSAETLQSLLPVASAVSAPDNALPPPGRLLALCDLLYTLACRAGVTPPMER